MSGAVPPPAARPLERAAWAPQPVCPGCGRCGRVDPAPAPQRAPLRAGVARCGGGGRASPGGGAFLRCVGRLVSGAVPPPAARPLERAARVPRPVCPGCGRCGRVDPAPAPQRAPLGAGVARCGGGGRAPLGGGAFHRCEGRLVSGAVPPPAARPLERAARVPVCVCVRVRALLGRVGRAGLPGAFWCASPFPLAALCFCFAWPPPGWGCPPLSRCPCRSSLPWRCALVLFLGLPLPGSSCARASFVSPAWPLAALWWFLPPPPPFLCLAVVVAPAWCRGVVVVFFFLFVFFFFLPRAPPCLWLSLVSGPGCPGPRRCAFFALLAFPLSALRALVPLSCFPPGWWLLPVGCCPPPPSLSRGFRRCRSVLCAVCCVVLCVPGCGAAPRCCALCSPVLCCSVLCCARWVPLLVAPCPLALPVALGPCALRRCVLRCSPVLCVFCRGALVRAVVRRSALCCVCPGVLCCAFPVLSALCGAVLRCAGALALCCSCGACCCWRLVLWCSVVLCCRVVLCCCALLSCCGAVGACFALLWAVVLCCVVLLVGCAVFCPVVVAACCGALLLVLRVPCLLRSVRCGALLCWLWCPASLCRVLWRCAVVWCCAVVLCCRFAVLFVFALPSCGPSCGASVVCAVVSALCCGVSLCVVVFPWAFCGVVVLLWCVVVSCCAVRCPVVSCALCRVLRCRAALLGLFLAWVWLYLLEKPLQNFVKYFFFPLFFCFFFFVFFFLAFEYKIKLYTTQHTRVQQDHVRCCALRATRRS